MDLIFRNVRIDDAQPLVDVAVQAGKIADIAQHIATTAAHEIQGDGKVLVAGFVEGHLHLEKANVMHRKANRSGTLKEAIAVTAELKPTLTREDIRERSIQVLRALVQAGTTYVRAHAEFDPAQGFTGLEVVLELREEFREVIDIQVVAFPQEGILKLPGMQAMMAQAMEMGADVVGGIPHFENTRDQGVSSVKFLMELAERTGCLVDVHCDETDDPQSRFLEVLAEEARVRGMGARVTASHTTAMGSYDNAYCSKLFRLLKMSGINFVSCPTESIHLQGRFDTYPKRRGLTRVAEIDRAGMNVCFGQDSIVDPWYPLGNGNILRILEAGLHICHMLGYEDLQRCLDLITDNSARTLNLGERYGIEVGRPANLLLLSAPDDYEMVRSQGHALVSVRHGKVLMRRTPAQVERFS